MIHLNEKDAKLGWREEGEPNPQRLKLPGTGDFVRTKVSIFWKDGDKK